VQRPPMPLPEVRGGQKDSGSPGAHAHLHHAGEDHGTGANAIKPTRRNVSPIFLQM
jgi:hypothetical protein